jgi:hypothetical protein
MMHEPRGKAFFKKYSYNLLETQNDTVRTYLIDVDNWVDFEIEQITVVIERDPGLLISNDVCTNASVE